MSSKGYRLPFPKWGEEVEASAKGQHKQDFPAIYVVLVTCYTVREISVQFATTWPEALMHQKDGRPTDTFRQS